MYSYNMILICNIKNATTDRDNMDGYKNIILKEINQTQKRDSIYMQFDKIQNDLW